MTVKTTLIAIALGVALAPRAIAQQTSLRTEWSKNVTEYRGQTGRRVTLVCPAGGRVGTVYGSDEYTDDSSVCSAAVHAGQLTVERGGVVTIVIGGERSAYVGSMRNGVTSLGFDAWPRSFSFAPSGSVGRVDWKTTAQGLNIAGKPIVVECPAGGSEDTVYGTDSYTDDSPICVAAVHAGVIGFASGGRVTIEPVGERAAYVGSARNGVSSRDFGSWPNGFRFSSTATAARVPSVTGDLAPAPVTTVQRATTSEVNAVTTTAPPVTSGAIATGAVTAVDRQVTNTRALPAELKTTQDLTTATLTVRGTALVPVMSMTASRLTIVGTFMDPLRSITTSRLVIVGQ